MIAAYLDQLTRRLQAQLDDRLIAAWVVGSSALGDFDPARSDIDVQAVATDRLPREELERLARDLTAIPCPVRGLEFVLYAREDLPAFQLNLNTGPGMDHHEGYDPDAEPRFWFTLDTQIAREHARPLAGPHPRDLLPELPRPRVLDALTESLNWYQDFGGPEAVFAACRAWAWSTDGHWRSKAEAATWALDRAPIPIAKALAKRTDSTAPGPTQAEIDELIATVRDEFPRPGRSLRP